MSTITSLGILRSSTRTEMTSGSKMMRSVEVSTLKKRTSRVSNRKENLKFWMTVSMMKKVKKRGTWNPNNSKKFLKATAVVTHDLKSWMKAYKIAAVQAKIKTRKQTRSLSPSQTTKVRITPNERRSKRISMIRIGSRSSWRWCSSWSKKMKRARSMLRKSSSEDKKRSELRKNECGRKKRRSEWRRNHKYRSTQHRQCQISSHSRIRIRVVRGLARVVRVDCRLSQKSWVVNKQLVPTESCLRIKSNLRLLLYPRIRQFQKIMSRVRMEMILRMRMSLGFRLLRIVIMIRILSSLIICRRSRLIRIIWVTESRVQRINTKLKRISSLTKSQKK